MLRGESLPQSNLDETGEPSLSVKNLLRYVHTHRLIVGNMIFQSHVGDSRFQFWAVSFTHLMNHKRHKIAPWDRNQWVI